MFLRNLTYLCLGVIFISCQQKKLIKENKDVRFTQNPQEVRLITSDIEQFWTMFDEEMPLFTPHEVKEKYFEAGTYALHSYFEQEIKTAYALTKLLNYWATQYYYRDIRPQTLAVNKERTKVIEALEKFKQLYPPAVFTDIVFVIGALNNSGVVLPNGQIVIAAEMFAKTQKAEVRPLGPWLQSVLRGKDSLPVIVLHEMIHVQQRQHAKKNELSVGGETLLDRAILEGSADFITHLVLGDFLNKNLLTYGNSHEEQLWKEFSQNMHHKDFSQWLYNGNASAKRPADLGYYIGYKIAESYYKKAADKQKAVKEIIQMKSGTSFLERSGYGPKMK